MDKSSEIIQSDLSIKDDPALGATIWSYYFASLIKLQRLLLLTSISIAVSKHLPIKQNLVLLLIPPLQEVEQVLQDDQSDH